MHPSARRTAASRPRRPGCRPPAQLNGIAKMSADRILPDEWPARTTDAARGQRPQACWTHEPARPGRATARGGPHHRPDRRHGLHAQRVPGRRDGLGDHDAPPEPDDLDQIWHLPAADVGDSAGRDRWFAVTAVSGSYGPAERTYSWGQRVLAGPRSTSGSPSTGCASAARTRWPTRWRRSCSPAAWSTWS